MGCSLNQSPSILILFSLFLEFKDFGTMCKLGALQKVRLRKDHLSGDLLGGIFSDASAFKGFQSGNFKYKDMADF